MGSAFGNYAVEDFLLLGWFLVSREWSELFVNNGHGFRQRAIFYLPIACYSNLKPGLHIFFQLAMKTLKTHLLGNLIPDPSHAIVAKNL